MKTVYDLIRQRMTLQITCTNCGYLARARPPQPTNPHLCLCGGLLFIRSDDAPLTRQDRQLTFLVPKASQPSVKYREPTFVPL